MQVSDEAGAPCGIEGHIERVYWRDGEAWVRLRTRAGGWLSVPWRQTHLAPLTVAEGFPTAPRLSPAALLALVRHLRHRCPAGDSTCPPEPSP